ncbi:MAG TPA: terminase family protein [Phycisphaerae bacterium]|nr:terminase family protein [Phycisphaerae bacterium]
MTPATSSTDNDSLRSWHGTGGNVDEMVRARLEVLDATAEEQTEYRELFADGWSGFLSWVNLACWTFDPRDQLRHLPLLTWEIQDIAGREVWLAIDEGRDVLIDKSRDMGATWLCVAAFVWHLLFVPDTPLLAASRKEEYVDARGNPDTLFWKADYLISNLPSWLRPKTERRHMHLANLDNGSVIDGESTTSDLGRGGRRKAILLDEFAAVENGHEILSATVDAAPCRIFNSTPKGRGNAFADVRFSGKVKVITLHWRAHPHKGWAARQVEADGKVRWTSPWYEAECARRTSRREIAQELDIDYLASGDTFFDLDVCQRIRASGQLRPPLARGELRFGVDTLTEGTAYRMSEVRWMPQCGKRRLSLWCPLSADGGLARAQPRGDSLRPRQDRNYVAFVDVAHGTGASNSVIKVADTATREEVASFVCPDTPPHELARYAVALCTWFGGQVPTLLGWEANGPGGIFGLEVYRLGYRAVLGNRNVSMPWRPEDDRIGWYSSRDKKADLLGELRRALAREELIIHEQAAITELEQYIYYPSGSVGPSGLADEADGARAAHGDRVIAAAGLLLCMAEQPAAGARGGAPPAASFADRRDQYIRQVTGHGRWER